MVSGSTEYETIHIDGLVQDCIISLSNTLKMLQICTKP